VLNNYVSIARAEEDYGVVIDPATMQIDAAKTKTLRSSVADESGRDTHIGRSTRSVA
jgi:hypothetical protein